ncbi:TolC family protein [Sphingomonas sp. CFBP 13720]|uniref:TolC family protein n=1 Tax=Sphingomonas sp. CFBP 13720 TaxID=2775302 RepID=UPI002016F884|nr:TolC family protein [Sphingomonas sp. CFBP 13720]
MSCPWRDFPRYGVQLVITAAIGMAGAVGATEADAPLTLERAARAAVEWHPVISEAAGVLNARGEQVAVARAGYLPQVSAGVGTGIDSRIGGNWRPRPQLNASQMLYDFGKVAGTVDAARADTAAGRAELLLAIDRLIRDTGYAVVEAQRAAALRIVAIDQQASVGELARLVRSRADLGAATRSDALQAQARVEAAQATSSQIEAEERRWGSNLAFLIGQDTPPTQIVADVPAWLMQSCERTAPGWDVVPEVMAADARADRAAADFRRSKAERYPTLSIAGDASTDIADPLGNRSLYGGGLRVSGNVFGGGASRARLRGAAFAVEAAGAAARNARNDTRQRLAEARQQIAALTRLIGTQASREANMRETAKLYRLQYLQMGTRTLVDLLNAEQELHQARFDSVNTLHDLRRLELECLYSSGRARDAFGLTGTRVRGVTL